MQNFKFHSGFFIGPLVFTGKTSLDFGQCANLQHLKIQSESIFISLIHLSYTKDSKKNFCYKIKMTCVKSRHGKAVTAGKYVVKVKYERKSSKHARRHQMQA